MTDYANLGVKYYAWIGLEKLSLTSLWEFYLRRFAIEHWNRFFKQRLHWTKAKLGNTEKGQRWSDLMTILTENQAFFPYCLLPLACCLLYKEFEPLDAITLHLLSYH